MMAALAADDSEYATDGVLVIRLVNTFGDADRVQEFTFDCSFRGENKDTKECSHSVSLVKGDAGLLAVIFGDGALFCRRGPQTYDVVFRNTEVKGVVLSLTKEVAFETYNAGTTSTLDEATEFIVFRDIFGVIRRVCIDAIDLTVETDISAFSAVSVNFTPKPPVSSKRVAEEPAESSRPATKAKTEEL